MTNLDKLQGKVTNCWSDLGVSHLSKVSVLVLAALAWFSGQSRAEDCADVELVLAIDGSGSIDPAEFALQQRGYAAAFRRDDVHEALQAAGVVDVAVLIWGDTEMALHVLPWVRLDDTASYLGLAADLQNVPRLVHGNTGLGRAVWHSLDLFDLPGRCSFRRIINVSGDGYETISPRSRNHIPLAAARKRAEAMRVEINALAIENEALDLSEWYLDRLSVGAGAFVIRIDGFDSFADAIAEKLIREIAPPEVAFSPISPLAGKT